MHSSSAELQSLKICQDDKFLSKLLSRERSITGSSGRAAAYYTGISGSVPFTWETQPGTPRSTLTVGCNKQQLDDTPPLTPPPAYYTTDEYDQAAGRRISAISRSRLLKTLFSHHSKDAGSWDNNAAVQRTSSSSTESISSSFSGKRPGSGRSSGSMSSSIIFDDEKKVDVLDHPIMEKLVLTDRESSPIYVTCFGMKKIRSQGRRKGAVAPETKFAAKRGFWSRARV